MNRVNTALKELVAAILDSPEYREFDRQLSVMKNYPELKSQIDAFRQENFTLQHSTDPEELLDKVDEFSKRYEEFRRNPMVEAFLSAELDFCRMVQDINQEILEAVNFE